MKIIYHGHSCVEIALSDGQTILIDPYISQNPTTTTTLGDVKPDWILLTHGHGDHLGDTIFLAKEHDATVIAIVELASYLEKASCQTVDMNLGGSFTFPFGRLKFVKADHSSSIEVAGETQYLGVAAGLILEVEGQTLYHAGDTAAFSEMSLFGEWYGIDVAFLPIGDYYTMGPKEALWAATALQAERVVPIHYNTFPVISQDPDEFINQLPAGVGKVLTIGEIWEP